MIDPKQKAELIVEKFYSANQPYTFEPKAAKECAKIAVELVISTFDVTTPCAKEYWQEVLNELNKM